MITAFVRLPTGNRSWCLRGSIQFGRGFGLEEGLGSISIVAPSRSHCVGPGRISPGARPYRGALVGGRGPRRAGTVARPARDTLAVGGALH